VWASTDLFVVGVVVTVLRGGCGGVWNIQWFRDYMTQKKRSYMHDIGWSEGASPQGRMGGRRWEMEWVVWSRILERGLRVGG
jgi:hypothetical protein